MAIRWEKLTVKAQEAIQRAVELASQNGNPEVLPVWRRRLERISRPTQEVS